jgi:hypothetical protein
VKHLGVLDRHGRVLAEVRALSRQLAELEGRVAAKRDERDTVAELAAMTKEKTQLEITLDRVREDHAREKREIEHMVGLHRKRVEFEIERARRETELEVREENLSADKARFEAEMKFTRDRMSEEVGYLKEMIGHVLERLPKVEVNKTLELALNSRAEDDR